MLKSSIFFCEAAREIWQRARYQAREGGGFRPSCKGLGLDSLLVAGSHDFEISMTNIFPEKAENPPKRAPLETSGF